MFGRSNFALVLFVSAIGASQALAFSSFPSRIPNGTAIDGSGCVNCHFNPGGGGARNAFGSDMAQYNINWASVCSLDSDGDGESNGLELGDPDCVWTMGATPARTTAITNPGDPNSTSANPGGGGGGTGGGTCPPNSSPVNGGCACDAGYQPNAQGTACEPTSGGGGGGGGGSAPAGWLCDPTWMGDGECDCGCGVQDSDCATNDLSACMYNECDVAFPNTPGLQPDPADPSQCIAAGAGGGGTGGGAGGGTCPPNSSPVNGGCACDAGFVPDAQGTSCVSDGSAGGTGGGTDTGNTGGGTDTGNTGGTDTGNAGGDTGNGGSVDSGGTGGGATSGVAADDEAAASDDPPEEPASGCSSSGAPRSLSVLGIVLLMVAARRRRRDWRKMKD